MANFYQDGKHLDIVFAATVSSGSIIAHAGGVGIVDPKNDGTDYVSGEVGSVTVYGVVEVANSGVVFADGAVVGYDQTADEAVAAAGGDLDIGTCVGGAGATDKVLVWLNQGI